MEAHPASAKTTKSTAIRLGKSISLPAHRPIRSACAATNRLDWAADCARSAQGKARSVRRRAVRIPLFPKPTNSASLRKGALPSVPSQRPMGKQNHPPSFDAGVPHKGAGEPASRRVRESPSAKTRSGDARERAITAANISLTAGDRDRYAVLTHLVDRRNATPAWCPSIRTVLKVKIYGWQLTTDDARLPARDRGVRQICSWAGPQGCNNRPQTTRPLNRSRNCRRRRAPGAVAAGPPLSSTCRSTSRVAPEARRSHCIEKWIDIVEQPPWTPPIARVTPPGNAT